MFEAIAFIIFILLPVAAPETQQCNRNPVIFNFGDSNSDTGGYCAAYGVEVPYPYGRALSDESLKGRISDGLLIIDFLCENLGTQYLSPYLDSLQHNYKNGVNFAIGGATIATPTTVSIPFSLNVQISQFKLFHRRFTEGSSDYFKNALYTIDIGQNDLTGSLEFFPYARLIDKIPSFVDEIRSAVWEIYLIGGRNFWIHNTAPFGCFPLELGKMRNISATDFDDYGCIKSLNEAAKLFNHKLEALCQHLRTQLKDSTIVYVDMYSIKYELIANASSYGFKNPLDACCGYEKSAYNYNPKITCTDKGHTVCNEDTPYVSWDGVHFTEAANAIIASKILSTNYSTPQLQFNFFCNAAASSSS